MTTAAVITIGNELLSGDIVDTNAVWLAKRLERNGVHVQLMETLPDDVERIASFVARAAADHDLVLVTGGLGGTPDDLTREAIAAAFAVEQQEVPELVSALRNRFPHDPDYAVAWAQLPVGSRPLENPLGGAPGFLLENVYVLPGLPAEMEAMFETFEEELRAGPPIASWRRVYRTRESEIARVLAEATDRYAAVRIGSYPTFAAGGPEVEVVLKCADSDTLEVAVAWLEQELGRVTS
jgi:molybdenum cofactor synthesis domain-containing protein